MIRLGVRALALLFALACLVGGAARAAGQAAGEAPAAAADAARQQVLVMLRLPPRHYRPDGAYAGGYLDDSGGAARRRVAGSLAAAYGLRVRDSWPMPVIGVDCFLMEDVDGRPLARVLDALAHDPRVAWVQPLGEYRAMEGADPLYPVQPAAQAWHLADLHRVSTGRNVTVAVIDSGIDTGHPDLAGQVAVRRNFVDGLPDGGEAHGTAVAGIIAARAGNGIGITGVAPQARLLALRACWESGGQPARCNSLTLAKAINFALENGAHILNLSLAGPTDRLLQALIDAALARGVTVVGATDPARMDGGYPASHPGVIAVARGGERHTLVPAALVAPGTDVPTSLPGARWGMVSGSSYSAAHVAGLAALLAQLHPRAGPQELRHRLDEAAFAGAAHPDAAPAAPAGSIDACAALARAVNACVCLCTSTASASARPLR